MMQRHLVLAIVGLMCLCGTAIADNGLITKQSKYSVSETIDKFETAIKAKSAGGWTVFTRIDHAAAAKAAGLEMRPRTVIVFGNPKGGTPQMVKSPTMGIDLPMKALVWQDDQDKVWLSYNSAAYNAGIIAPRHGLAVPEPAQKMLEAFLADISDQSTK